MPYARAVCVRVRFKYFEILFLIDDNFLGTFLTVGNLKPRTVEQHKNTITVLGVAIRDI